jgi:hypothetical protein
MMNQPLPHQLTVGKLRQIIEGAPDETVVTLQIPAGFQADPQLVTGYNLEVRYSGDLMIVLAPQTTTSEQRDT